MLRDEVGFAEHQEKATSDYKLTLTRNSNNAVLSRATATGNAQFLICVIDWYVPHYRPSVAQQAITCKQFSAKTTTELRYVEKNVFLKDVKTQNLRLTFELGSQKVIIVPNWITVGFQLRNRLESQKRIIDSF